MESQFAAKRRRLAAEVGTSPTILGSVSQKRAVTKRQESRGEKTIFTNMAIVRVRVTFLMKDLMKSEANHPTVDDIFHLLHQDASW